jgi:HAD superfamily hydrolase (TIGR01509 family)
MPVFLRPEEIERIGETLQKERGDFFKDEYLPHVHAFPMVRELFERIKADGKRIVLASSAEPDELERYEQIAEVADLVEHKTSSGDAEKSKPHPDIFHAALAKLGHPDPSTVIVVGDSPWDAIAAAKAGLKTIGLLCGGFAKDDLKAAGCKAIYTNPAELLMMYDDSPLGARAEG